MIIQNLGSYLKENDYKLVITGVNGWFGRYLLEILHQDLGEQIDKYIVPISSSSPYISLSNANIKTVTMNEALNLGKFSRKTILCHFAFITKDKVQNYGLDEYVEENLKIRNVVAELIDNIKPTSMLYISSGAVYMRGTHNIVSEIIDCPYGYLKYQDELFFTDLSKREKFALIIPRVFNVSGPYINKTNIYALSDFIIQALSKSEIEIKAEHLVYRSYIHLNDLFNICFSWLCDSNRKENYYTFDTVHGRIVELEELAMLIANVLDIKLTIKRKNNAALEEDYYVGDVKAQNVLLKRYGIKLVNYEKQILDVYNYIRHLYGKACINN